MGENKTNDTLEEVKTTEEKKKGSSDKKNNKKNIILIIVLLVVLVAGVTVGVVYNNTQKEKTETELKEFFSEYRMSGNSLDEFDLSFLKTDPQAKNVIYSPLSIKYALSMIRDGAQGNSKGQLDALIGEYKSNKYTNSANMSFANAMFIENGFKNEIESNYINSLKNNYNASVFYDSFATPDVVNKWVGNQTFGLINDLVDDISDKKFILVNALAIDMEWKKLIQATTDTYDERYSVSYPHEEYSAYISPIEGDYYGTVKFNKGAINAKAVEIGASINNYDIINTLGEENIRKTVTKAYLEWLKEDPCGSAATEPDATTYVDNYIKELSSNYKRVDASTDFKFYDDENVKVFSKELKEYNNTTLEYIGIMPKKASLSDYIKTVSAKSLSETINKTKPIELNSFEKGNVYKITGGIPLFKYDYELDLIKDLQKLGVKDIFESGKANLSGITKATGVIIDEVTHKANIEFSNEGIKAAAATQGGGAGAAGCWFDYIYEVPLVEINLTFDNPFLYIIRDKKTGEVWFIGTVYEPITNPNDTWKVIK